MREPKVPLSVLKELLGSMVEVINESNRTTREAIIQSNQDLVSTIRSVMLPTVPPVSYEQVGSVEQEAEVKWALENGRISKEDAEKLLAAHGLEDIQVDYT